MLADADGSGTTNGKSRAYNKGKSSQRPTPTSSANGSSKYGSSKLGTSKSRGREQFYGHDREEVTRILIQALSEMGYHAAADNVSQESGYQLESPTVASFRAAILGGNWAQAEELLDGAVVVGEDRIPNGAGLILASGADPNTMRFWIRQQKYLEYLERNEPRSALMVLRSELTSLYQNNPRVHFLSTLLMCQSKEELQLKSGWDGAGGQSRHSLLSELSRCISPSVMLPEHRLASLLQQVKTFQVENCLWHSNPATPSLYSDHYCHPQDFPTEPVIELDDHDGEVWQVVFSHDGSKLASCGNDRGVLIWELPSFKILHSLREHLSGAGNVAWSWDDTMLVTCGRDRYARLWDIATGKCVIQLSRFEEPVSSCVWAPDNQSFITGALDKGGSLVQWNLAGERIHDWRGPQRVEDLALSPDGRWLVAMDCAQHIHVFNFRTREFEYQLDFTVRLASISISLDSKQLLVNQTDGCAQLIDLAHRKTIRRYTGHKGGECVIRAVLGGAHEMFVMSGSEDGLICIWSKSSGECFQQTIGHHPRCNSVAWCPTDPKIFASCGDDGKIIIWSNDQWRRDHIEAIQRKAASREQNT